MRGQSGSPHFVVQFTAFITKLGCVPYLILTCTHRCLHWFSPIRIHSYIWIASRAVESEVLRTDSTALIARNTRECFKISFCTSSRKTCNLSCYVSCDSLKMDQRHVTRCSCRTHRCNKSISKINNLFIYFNNWPIISQSLRSQQYEVFESTIPKGQ
jgi:hypothetical protein